MWSFLISLIVLSNRTNIRFENNKNLPNLNNLPEDFKKMTFDEDTIGGYDSRFFNSTNINDKRNDELLLISKNYKIMNRLKTLELINQQIKSSKVNHPNHPLLKNLPIGTYDFVDDIDIWQDLADLWDNNLI
tara:strand:- start:4487 stop:4882 length:396 start_codon:yes stop_codon:yes gene_type:complete